MVNQPPYNLNDALMLLGQCTMELAYLRARVAQLEEQLPKEEKTPNGQVLEVPEKVA